MKNRRKDSPLNGIIIYLSRYKIPTKKKNYQSIEDVFNFIDQFLEDQKIKVLAAKPERLQIAKVNAVSVDFWEKFTNYTNDNFRLK